jgi:hypothetical protein
MRCHDRLEAAMTEQEKPRRRWRDRLRAKRQERKRTEGEREHRPGGLFGGGGQGTTVGGVGGMPGGGRKNR